MIAAANLPNYKLVSTLLVLPILIIAIILWQYPHTIHHVVQNSSVETILSVNVEYEDIINTSTTDLYLQKLKAIVSNENLNELATYCALFLSFFILLIGGIGLLLDHSIQNRKQMKSNKQLYRNLYLAKLFFPIILILLSSSSILLLACLLMIILVKYVSSIFALTTFAIMVIIIISLSWKIFKSCTEKLDEETLNLIGINLTRAEAPELWQFVQSIADKGQLRMPDYIVIGMNHCFFVTESPISFWNGKSLSGGATLYLSIPYMHYMSESDVAAIIGHELAHFTYNDIQYTHHFFTISKRLIRNTTAINLQPLAQNTSVWDWLYSILTYPTLVFAEHFLDSYHETVQQWKRCREANADKIGSKASSTKQMAQAMLRVAIITPAIEYIIEEFWFAGGKKESVLNSIQQLINRHGLPDPLMLLQSIQSHPLDNHPTLQRRLELLNIKLTDPMLEEASDTQHSDLLKQLKLI